jgi:hypothetical protein
MPRKKKPDESPSPVPEYIRKSPLIGRRRIGKEGLSDYAEAMKMLHAPEALRVFWEATLTQMHQGNTAAIKLVAQMFEYAKMSTGISINQHILQQNANAMAAASIESGEAIGFDQIVRDIAERRAGHALPPPPEDLIEGSVEDVRPADTGKILTIEA